MPNPFARLGASDFWQAIARLAPRGIAWPRDEASVQMGIWGAIADVLAAFHARAADLSEVESDPAQTSELLGDWERAWGLPDPCVPAGQTVEQRRAALLAKMAARGGQSRAYFIGIAAAIGYPITITEFSPFRVGHSAVGTPLYGAAWVFAWQVNAPETTIVWFRAGVGAAGEPLRSWGNEALECLINALKPAHTIVFFAYGS